jgi:hypothetical protein
MTISSDPEYLAWLSSLPKPPKPLIGRPPNYITHKGQRHTLKEWSKIVGIKPQAIKQRLHYGWTIAEALETKEQKNQFRERNK